VMFSSTSIFMTSVISVWNRQSSLKRACIIYLFGLFLLSNLFFLIGYLDGDLSYLHRELCADGNSIVAPLGNCITPVKAYLGTPILLLTLIIVKVTVFLSGNDHGILWSGPLHELGFEAWLIFVPIFYFATFLYQKYR
jgi:hypothetical protein